MTFRRLILNSVAIGLVAGLLLSISQIMTVTPIIYAAEAYEDAPVVEQLNDPQSTVTLGQLGQQHQHGDLDEPQWSPSDGRERISYTLMSNVLAAIGFSAMLLSVMSLLQQKGITQLNMSKGLVWGIGGFFIAFAAPSLGLPPEIPGTEAAAVAHRQSWWLLSAVATAAGVFTLAFARNKNKLFGLVCIAIPFIVKAPHLQGPAFTHPSAQVVAKLTELQQQFIIATSFSNLLFWLVLGLLCGWALNRQTRVEH